MLAPSTYLQHVRSDSARFAAVLSELAPDRLVPTCPDWVAADLLWHLGEVQWFWSQVVIHRPQDPDGFYRAPERPGNAALVMDFFRRASSALQDALAGADAAEAAWSWADEQTVGFTMRRQAHEALIHRVDAEVAAGLRTSMDAELAADGVHEALGVMYGDPPSWMTVTHDPASRVRFLATDTGDSWDVQTAHGTGLSPESGTERTYGLLTWASDGAEPNLTLSGTAADLDCWLWHRPGEQEVASAGDLDTLHRLELVIADGIS